MNLNPFRLLVLFALLLLGAQHSLAQEPRNPVRRWQGIVQVASKTKLSMSFRLGGDEHGDPILRLSIPSQEVDDVEVIELKVGLEGLSFVLALPTLAKKLRPKFDLKYGENGSLTGTMTQDGKEFEAKFESSAEAQPGPLRAALRPQTPQSPFPYRTEDVRVPVKTDKWDHALAGTLTLPEGEGFGAGPYPTVIFITGSGAQDRDETLFGHKPFAVLADRLARHGIASLRCDDRGVFGSSGDARVSTTYDFVDDARAQLEFLTGHEGIGPIGVLGHSEGAVVGPMLAASDERVRFVIMFAGTGVPGLDVLVEQTSAMLKAAGLDENRVAKVKEIQTKLLGRCGAGEPIEALREPIGALIEAQSGRKLPPEQLEPAVTQAAEQLDIPWTRAFIALDPRLALRKVRQPTLVLNGDKDLQVLSWQNMPEIDKALQGNGDVTLRILPGLNHLFQKCELGTVAEYNQLTTTIEPEVLELVTAWILERFGK